jgi:hypothetical protein
MHLIFRYCMTDVYKVIIHGEISLVEQPTIDTQHRYLIFISKFNFQAKFYGRLIFILCNFLATILKK